MTLQLATGIVLVAVLVAAAGGQLNRYAERTTHNARHRADERAGIAPLAPDDIIAFRPLHAWYDELRTDDDLPRAVRLGLCTWQEYQGGMAYVRSLEVRLAASFGLVTDWAGVPR